MHTILPEQQSAAGVLRVVFYPSFGYLDDDGRTWNVIIRGSVFRPISDDYRKKLLVRLLRRLMKAEDHDLESDIFRERIGAFLVAGQRGRRIAIRVGSRIHFLHKKSKRNGQFSGKLRISLEEARRLEQSGHLRGGWLHFHVVTRYGDIHDLAGRAQLLAPQGTSVISDIDDTIKHTQITRRRALLTNTFLREFAPVPGMRDLYQGWAEQGAAFHYVSSSPWQLYDPLAELCRSESFPDGTFHLRMVRFRDPTVLRLFITRRLGKRRVIRSIMRAFPRRRFILVGDSGEKDPEIYGSIARKCNGQVARILIRNLHDRKVHESRCNMAFRQLPTQTWKIFQDAAELAEGPMTWPNEK